MAKVKTVTYFKANEIKKEITKQSVRNSILEVSILGYVASGEREPFEEGELYYCVSVHTSDFDFDMEVMDSTSLAKVKQRQVALCNALYGYRGNDTKLVEYSEENESFYSDN